MISCDEMKDGDRLTWPQWIGVLFNKGHAAPPFELHPNGGHQGVNEAQPLQRHMRDSRHCQPSGYRYVDQCVIHTMPVTELGLLCKASEP